MRLAKSHIAGFAALALAGTFAVGTAYAQDDERERRDAQETKQAQAVSKEIYDRIQKAQEEVDAEELRRGAAHLESATKQGQPDRLRAAKRS